MSDSEENVAQFVVSASLSSCFSPDVNESNKDSNHSSLPSNNVFKSSKSISDSINTDIAPTAVHSDYSGPEIEKITPTDKESKNIVEVLHDSSKDENKGSFDGHADKGKSETIKYHLAPSATQSKSQNDGLAFVDVHDTCDLEDSSDKNIYTDCLDKQIDSSKENQYSVKNFDCKVHATKENNYSGSTDGTLQNSEESSDFEGSVINTRQDFKRLCEKQYSTMGNKQTQAARAQSDDDTPDDGRTKCCQVPKRKMKDKSNRSNRASRNDDLNFDSNEVYPFEGRIASEQETNEPVELEPFEIVETDDIKFVPGAGTSEILKSVSEPRFLAIAEELPISEETLDPSNQASSFITEKSPNVPLYIDKGNRLAEPGTATAHSTFEFKQVKPKTKFISKVTSDQKKHNYENIDRLDETNESNAVCRKVSSSGSSKSNSSSSSKDASRKNSKDAKQKPSRKGKSKNSGDRSDQNFVGQDDKDSKTKKDSEKKTQSVRDSEIDRKIDSVLMLTQTMFSQTKVPEVQERDQSEPVALNQYENVGVCAQLESSGIVIRHKNMNQSNKPQQETGQNMKTGVNCSGNNCGESTELKGLNDRRHHYSKLSKDIVEISESGTLIIKSLADLPSDGYTEEVEEQKLKQHSRSVSVSSCDTHDDTEVKVPYDVIDKTVTEIKKGETDVGKKCEDKDSIKVTENVPPPSPLAMEVLEEEEEDAFEEDDDDTNNGEDDRRKSEILEFTENVCKRLSHLLESISDQDNDEDENTSSENRERERKMYEDHIYETIDGFSKLENTGIYSNNITTPCENRNANQNHQVSQPTGEINDCHLAGDELSSAVTSASGELETDKNLYKPATSDDDLPDYFDPRQVPPPKNDPEIFDDFDSHDNKRNESYFSEEVSNVVNANKVSFNGLQYDNIVLENKDKNLSLPIQSFEPGLISDAQPSSLTEDILDITPTSEAQPKHTALPELAKADEEMPVQFDTSGRQSATCTESDIDVSEHRDDLSTDSMLADDEAEETMEILFTKTYTEPVEGAEVFLSCTVVNSAYKDEQKKSETWLSDEALEYFEANASEVMSTAFLKAKKEMKDIQVCLQSLRQQMEHFHSDCDDISLPEIPVESLSPDYFGVPIRKAVTD